MRKRAGCCMGRLHGVGNKLSKLLVMLVACMTFVGVAPLAAQAAQGVSIGVGEEYIMEGSSGWGHSWESSNPDVVKVSNSGKNGTITGKSEGKATVTHTYYTGISQKSETWDVTVTQGSYSLYYYGLIPGANADAANVNANWMGLGVAGIVHSSPASAYTAVTDLASTSYTIDESNPRKALFPDITIDGVTYKHAQTAEQEMAQGYYTLQQMRVRAGCDGANAGYNEYNSTVASGTKTFHYDWIIVLNQTNKNTVNFLVEYPDITGWSAVQKYARTVNTGTAESQVAQDPSDMENYSFAGKTYTFDGWYTDEACTQKANFDGTINANVNYYGKYVTGDDSYAKPDKKFIYVEKTFTGLESADQIPDDFAINVRGSATYKCTLDSSTTDGSIVSGDGSSVFTKNADGSYTVKWKIPVDAGTYTVTESNVQVKGMRLDADANGVKFTDEEGNLINAGVEVSTKSSTFDFDNSSVTVANKCSSTDWEIPSSDSAFLLIGLTDSTYICWTPQALTATQRQEFVAKYPDGNGLNLSDVGQVAWYSGKDLEKGIYSNKGVVSYDPETKRLNFNGETSNWRKYSYGQYEVTEAVSADLAISNAYTKKVGGLELSKTVMGNAANPSKHYPMTVTGLASGQTYQVAVSGNADAHETTLTADQDGMATVSLCNGETAVIQGIASDSKVAVRESGISPVAYVGTAVSVNGTLEAEYGYLGNFDSSMKNAAYKLAQDGSYCTADHEVTIGYNANQSVNFANNATGAPDEGLNLNILPFVGMLALALCSAGAYLLYNRRRKNLKGFGDAWKE